MKDLLQNLFEQLKNSNAPTRWVIAAALTLVAAIGGYTSYRAANPHFVLLRSNLDESQLALASSAIAGAGIRFDTSHGPGPYSIWVEAPRQYEALNAIYLEGALKADPRGILPSSSGASSVFLGSDERRQQLQKRKWQEVEKMLEVYNWIAQATVTSSTPKRSPLMRPEPESISVVLQLRGISEPDREQKETVATIITASFGVPKDHVVVSDQYGRRIFDGSRDEALDNILSFQREHDTTKTREVQSVLDVTYGPGRATATVHSEWTYDRIESVDEAVDPSSKTQISKQTFDSTTPVSANRVGGAVGASANQVDGNAAVPAGSGEEASATTAESREEYLIGRKTIHMVQNTPLLQRLTIALLLDDSLATELPKAEAWVKGIVGFDDVRGDRFTSATALFQSIERDEEGNPVQRQDEAPAEPMSSTVQMLIERGVEIVAALGFLLVLMKSLKKSNKSESSATPGANGTTPGQRPAALADEEVDLELLARRQVEELLNTDPERVSALLSRWALEDNLVGNK